MGKFCNAPFGGNKGDKIPFYISVVILVLVNLLGLLGI
jgi:hypothetical protein